MNLLITGSEGFMGRHLMARYPDAIGMDKKSYSSTSNYELLLQTVEQNNIEMIVHLGANCSSQISLRDPYLDFLDNVVGTFNICEVARQKQIPVIFNSTMKVYPGEDGIVPPYGMSKQFGEDYLTGYHKIYGLDYIINRPSSVYGPLQDGSEDGGWFTWFIDAAVNGKTITLFGDGTQSRDVLYIDDCTDMLVDQIENFSLYKNHDYDWGGGLENLVSLNELLGCLSYYNTIQQPKLAGDVQSFVTDNSKASQVNGWKPKVHWTEGLERTRQWLESV